MSQTRISNETLEEALSTFPVNVPDTEYVLVKYEQYFVFRQATLSLLDVYKREANGTHG